MKHSLSQPKQHNSMRPLDIAFRLGIQDARDGDLCVPEMYFARRDQQIAYAKGYESVAGETPGSRWFLQGAK